MKFIVTTLVVLCAMFASANAFAQYNGNAAPGPVVLDYSSGIVDNASALRASGTCVSQIQSVCNGAWNAPGCAPVVIECDKVRQKAARVATGLTRKQVKDIVEKAVEGLASKADLDALAVRVAKLEADLPKLREDVDGLKTRADADDVRDEGQQRQLTDHEGRIVALEKGEEEQNKKIAALSDEVMFEGGASFFGAPNVQVLGAAVGLQLKIADTVAVNMDAGLGYAFDGDVAVTAKGGVIFYVAEKFGLGPTIMFAKEGFDDDGDVEIGCGAELRFRTGTGFFISGQIGLGGEGVLQTTGKRPDGEDLTKREWALAVMGGLMIGGEF